LAEGGIPAAPKIRQADDPDKVNAYQRLIFDQIVMDKFGPGTRPSKSVSAGAFQWCDPSHGLEMVNGGSRQD
jgi:hypothetical protein